MPIYFGNKVVDPNFGNKVIKCAYFGNKLVYVRDNSMPPMSMRFKFNNKNLVPTASKFGTWPEGSTWTKVTSNSNIWDFTYSSYNWNSAFAGKFKDIYTNGKVYMVSSTVVLLTGIDYLFKDCFMLKSIAPFAISMGCQNMIGTFMGCGVSSLPKLNTFGIKNMNYAFYDSELAEIPFDWDFASVTSMNWTFHGCIKLNYDISAGEQIKTLNTYHLNSLRYTFWGCGALKRAPGMDTSMVSSMGGALGWAGITATPGSDWQYGSLLYAGQLFEGCSHLTDGGYLPDFAPQDLEHFCNECINLITPPAISLTNATNMYQMYRNCSSMTSLWNTNYPSNPYGEKFCYIEEMYSNCKNIQSGISSYYGWISAHNNFNNISSMGVPVERIVGSAFRNCGVDGPASAELSVIPDIWK